MTALLALASALFVGGADFIGGMTSRTANGVRLACLVAVAGLPMALAVSLVVDAQHVSRRRRRLVAGGGQSRSPSGSAVSTSGWAAG